MPDINNQLILICGYSGTGKSASLRNIPNQSRWMYLNTEAGKFLPFTNTFDTYRITDPYQIYDGFDEVTNNPELYDGIIVDSLTFLMDMVETQIVLGSANTMKGWSEYQQYAKRLLQEYVVKVNKPVIFTAHVRDELDEKTMEMKTRVPVKGALANNGIEAYFSTIVAAKKLTLKDLESYKSDLLHITEDDEIDGFKYVFQTRITKNTVGERIRSPMGLFTRDQTYTDNDAYMLLNHLKKYYNIKEE